MVNDEKYLLREETKTLTPKESADNFSTHQKTYVNLEIRDIFVSLCYLYNSCSSNTLLIVLSENFNCIYKK